MHVSNDNSPLMMRHLDLPLNLPGSVSTHMSQINAEEGAVCRKRAHSEPAIADEIAFPNLYHAAKLCYTLPLMEKVSTGF